MPPLTKSWFITARFELTDTANVPCAEWLAESLTVTTTESLSLLVGAPSSQPSRVSCHAVAPLLEFSDQVYGGVPPLACS